MMMVAKVVSEFFMMVLAMLAAPADLKEFRVDMIDHSGRVETMIVRRAGEGFTLLEQQGDKTIERGTVRPVTGKPGSYEFKMGDGDSQTVDFAASLPGFDLEKIRKAQSLELKASDGEAIRLQRSGNVVYLTPAKGRLTYAAH